jgi:uncharacterized flavoprotein (TIGR03862 family)
MRVFDAAVLLHEKNRVSTRSRIKAIICSLNRKKLHKPMNNLSTPPTVTVVGGGPAGLMAAEKLASLGAKVTIYDQMSSVGRKFLMAGCGGLNLTHSESLETFISRYGTAIPWITSILRNFPPDALRAWCHGLGQETFVGSSGRIFPLSLKASPLLRAWLKRLEDLDVKFKLQHRWHGWDQKGDLLFNDRGENEIRVQSDIVILALGGGSWARLGSDGRWLDYFRAQNIDVVSLQPSNCGFVVPWSPYFSQRFAGQPLKPVIASFLNTPLQGEMMITSEGVEGGIIYALSSKLRDAIASQGQAVLTLDLRPGLSFEDLVKRLSAPRGSQSSSNYLRKSAGLSPLAIALLQENLEQNILPAHPESLARLIKETRLTLTAPCLINRAISSAGGIMCHEIDENCMLRKKPGVFAIGEMLDWEAPTGGYLLQGCFSTAVAAAQGAQNYLKLKAP